MMMADEETPETPEETPDAPERSEMVEPSAEEQVQPGADRSEIGQQVQPEAEQGGAPVEEVGEIAAVAEDALAEAPGEAAETTSGGPEDEGDEEPAPRVKPSVPGAHLEVDIVPEGVDPLGRGEAYEDPYAIEEEGVQEAQEGGEGEQEEELTEPIATAAIDLASGARDRATGKRKTAIARVTLRPGNGSYLVNGRALEEHFPRVTLQRNIRQPLETVGYQERMDVVARLHGGGISAQAGALRHGVSRALLEADPNLRGELKRRGFLTRDSRAKERKKAGLKKARKRPQFSKR